MTPNPPRWPVRLLRRVCDPELIDEIEGDLEEMFVHWVNTVGVRRARRRYAWHTIKFIRPFILKRRKSMNASGSLSIALNHFKTSWRNISRYRAFASINIAGLAMSFTCIGLIYALCAFHLRFDNFHADQERVYRLNTVAAFGEGAHWPIVPQPLGKAIRNDFTFAEVTARIRTYRQVMVVLPDVAGAPRFQEEGIVAFTEADYFGIFSYEGAAEQVISRLREPNTALITKRMASKYFGSTDAVNKIIRITSRDAQVDFRIIGVLEDTRPNTDLRAQIFISYENLKDFGAYYASDESWNSVNSGMMCYVKLKKGVSSAEVNTAMRELVKKYYDDEDEKVYAFSMQPLRDIHLNVSSDGAFSWKYVWILSAIGFFITGIASVNFVNLASAQVLNRSREAGIRKVLGSLRSQLYAQFITEAAIIAVLALVLSLGAIYTLAPSLNIMLNARLAIGEIDYFELTCFLSVIVALVVLVAGSYPAMVIGNFQPVTALKSKLLRANAGGVSMRRVLIVVQFVIAQALIIGMLVIASQVRYSTTSDPGFDKEAIVMMPIPLSDLTKMKTVYTQLASVPGVQEATLCYEPPASQSNSLTGVLYDNRQEEEPWEISLKDGDVNYLSAFGLKVLAGRNFLPSDTAREFLVNETFVSKVGAASPEEVIGKKIQTNGRTLGGVIVGVVRDFNNNSFHSEITPVCIMPNYKRYRTIAAKLESANATVALERFRELWSQTYPEFIFDFKFFDEDVARFYQTETAMLKLASILAVMAIAISCLGLYGLVSFMAIQKTKEISVRRILGANTGGLLWMFGKEFVILISIAFVISAPTTGWMMDKWLQGFAYHLPLSASSFIIALGSALLVAGITVIYHALSAATANPVDALRSE